MSACPTCKSVRCGNHAACARRNEQRKSAAAAGLRARNLWWLCWSCAWLYIGAWSYLTLTADTLTGLPDGAERRRAARGCSSRLSTPMLRFVLLATSPDSAEQEASALHAMRIAEERP